MHVLFLSFIISFFFYFLFFFLPKNLYTTHEFNTCPFQFENVTTLCYGYGSGSDHEGHHQTHFFEFCLRAYSSELFHMGCVIINILVANTEHWREFFKKPETKRSDLLSLFFLFLVWLNGLLLCVMGKFFLPKYLKCFR